MQRKFLLFLIIISLKAYSQNLITRFEQSNGTETPTYDEAINWWKKLDATSSMVKMMEMGPTDAGFPLHLILVSADKSFDIKSIKARNRSIILINNGIHPGEPDGIDASMLLIKEIVENRYKLPENVVLGIIPIYNIGGCLNRSNHYRIDQNGPKEFGFRGNSQNLDLNRDFIKCDSKEAITFARIFHFLDPDVFVDNHVSDGADYQHIMTLLTSQHKLGGKMGEFLNDQFEPALFKLMKEKGYDLVPYVNHSGETPDKGWNAYWDSPRYSSGYSSIWSTFSFVPETHMLKPYKQRVESTEALMKSFIEFTSANCIKIIKMREQTRKQEEIQSKFTIVWKLDRSKFKEIDYKGFEATYKASDVSGLPRLYYDKTKPFTKKVPFYDNYIDSISIQKPLAYIIPQGWWKVIDRLKVNNVQLKRIDKDTSIDVEWYRIGSYQSFPRPYEGHHLNYRVQIVKNSKIIKFRKGDYYIPLNQTANRFLIETLEPQAEDSYFAWNFFDPILGQKEGYSDYHFEDISSEYLKNNAALREKLEKRKALDSTFAKDADAQLNFVFQNSPYFEPAYMEHPVYRVIK